MRCFSRVVRLMLLLTSIIFGLWCPCAIDARFAPNHFLGTCLTQDWVTSTANQLKIANVSERDQKGRLVHPFLHRAVSAPRYIIHDPRTTRHPSYTNSCGIPESTTIYGVNATVNVTTGAVLDQGVVNGSLILSWYFWDTQALSTLVFSILAAEVYGYSVSLYSTPIQADTTQRMSSVGFGQCTPTHLDLEVWFPGNHPFLQPFMNESFAVGPIGYVGRTGLYTTTDFVNDMLNLTKYTTALYADFWGGYRYDERLITAVPVSTLRSNTTFFPPVEIACEDNTFGCHNHCSRTAACTAREALGKECMVVVMPYSFDFPGYLQAVMDNKDIPTYFCFLGWGGMTNYVLAMEKDKKPVLFFHIEPNTFHTTFAGRFQRVFLPRAVPERVILNTDSFGENGYGNKTTNPVDVDFPTATLGKFAASLLKDEFPINGLVSKFTIQELEINDLLRKYTAAQSNTNEVDPKFRAACNWVKENYPIWSLWLDPMPLCTFETHVRYEVSGCSATEVNKSTSNSLVQHNITFKWVQPEPEDETRPYNCDGGLTELPVAITTSRDCTWIMKNTRDWRPWVDTKPLCDASFYQYKISECDSRAKRTVQYSWLLPSPTTPSLSLECAGGVVLPSSILINCAYMPWTSPVFMVMAMIAGILIVVLVIAAVVVYRKRELPIIKRSQHEFLILMTFGGVMVCVASILYAGKPSRFLCASRPLFICCGFTTIFGSLVVKSLRVYRVFTKTALKKVTVTSLMMVKFFMILVVVDLVVLSGWFILDFPTPTVLLEPAYQFRGEIDRTICHSGSFLFTAVLVFWKAIVLMAGLYLSFLIRNVSADFQESIWIFASGVVVLVGCLILLPLAYLVQMDAATFYVFLSGILLAATAGVMALMLIPKWLKHKETDSKYTTSNSTTGGNAHSDKRSFIKMGMNHGSETTHSAGSKIQPCENKQTSSDE